MTALQSLNPFQQHLFPNEHILWTGQPKQGLASSGRDIVLIPVGLICCAVVIVWNVGMWRVADDGASPGTLVPLLVGLPFDLLGIYLLFGRFLHGAYIRKSIFYAVTNGRALILRGRWSPSLKSFDIRHPPTPELFEHGDGTGTIEFERNSPFTVENSYVHNPYGYHIPFRSLVPRPRAATQFFRIADPKRVYELICEQATSRTRPHAPKPSASGWLRG